MGSTATHDPRGIPKSLWARWKSLEATLNNPKMKRKTLQGQTVREYVKNGDEVLKHSRVTRYSFTNLSFKVCLLKGVHDPYMKRLVATIKHGQRCNPS
ncbi:MAG: hypothetical protein J7J11_02660 [Desulfurococcales archaeon]|nr:hypothetical protein [Desulfurococcales archaeon]